MTAKLVNTSINTQLLTSEGTVLTECSNKWGATNYLHTSLTSLNSLTFIITDCGWWLVGWVEWHTFCRPAVGFSSFISISFSLYLKLSFKLCKYLAENSKLFRGELYMTKIWKMRNKMKFLRDKGLYYLIQISNII